MIKNLVKDIVSAFKDHYDSQVCVIVDSKWVDKFVPIAKRYSIKTQLIIEPDHCIMVLAMKYRDYLRFMRTIQKNGMNLSERIMIDGSTRNGLITEVIPW